MIESTAVFFGFAFLAFLSTAIVRLANAGEACSFPTGSGGQIAGIPHLSPWLQVLLALVCGVVSALVKATSFPSFGLAAMGLVFLATPWSPGKDRRIRMVKIFMGVAILVFLCIGATLAWTRHADALKSSNPISAHLISNNLNVWNYGTLDQRMSWDFWKETVANRMILETLGSVWVLIFIPIAWVLGKWRDRITIICMGILFFIPILLFTNLHSIHPYYQYANSFWLVFSIALSLVVISRSACIWVSLVLGGAVLSLQIATYSKYYYVATTYTTHPVIQIGQFIREHTSKKSAIMVLGDDWSPEVAFCSERRGLYIPNWVDGIFPVDESAILRVIRNPETVLGGTKLGAVVVRVGDLERSTLPGDRRLALDLFLSSIDHRPRTETIGDYVIYLLK